MPANYAEHEAELRKSFQGLANQAAAMKPYTSLHVAAVAEGELGVKVKELMALAIGIVKQCEGCMLYHLRNALKAGATAQEVYEAANVAIMMGGGPAVVYAARLEEMLAQLES